MKANWLLRWTVGICLVTGLLYGLGRLSLFWYSHRQLGQVENAGLQPTSHQTHYRNAIVRTLSAPAEVVPTIQPPSPSVSKVFRQVHVLVQPKASAFSGQAATVELLVHNKSAYLIERAEVTVVFSNEKGQPLQEETVPVERMKPGTKNLLRVHNKIPAAKLRCYLLNIYLPRCGPRTKTV